MRRGAALALATALVVGGLGTVAGPVQAGAGYALLTARSSTGTKVLRWNPCQTAITYKVNTSLAREDGVGATKARARALDEVRTAMNKVATATGIRVSYTGTTAGIPTGSQWYTKQGADSEIVIAYVDQDSAATRTTLLSSSRAWATGGQVYKIMSSGPVVVGRGYVVLDADKTRRSRSGFGAGATRGNLVLHELGHVMGLDHVSLKSQLMYPVISSSSPNGYASGDRAGLAKVGAAAGCIPSAASAWSGS